MLIVSPFLIKEKLASGLPVNGSSSSLRITACNPEACETKEMSNLSPSLEERPSAQSLEIVLDEEASPLGASADERLEILEKYFQIKNQVNG